MSTAQHVFGHRVTFRELFNHHSHVEVPIIQRDYAQGRDSAFEVRELFLEALHSALSKSPHDPTLPLDLDFVYGSIEGSSEPRFCPLDGQQRLTTLFLLHWYLAWQDEVANDFTQFVETNGRSRFAYAVRASSEEFFDTLVCWFPDMRPPEVEELRPIIEDQSWFFQWWKRDPTIQSALTMLEAIHKKFQSASGLYERLVETDSPYITFQLLDLKDFGLSDDLYIKMNARGKPLTNFETFKALVEKHIGQKFPDPDAHELFGKPASRKQYFSHQIDTTWAELFWTFRDKGTNLFDARVMNLIRVTGIITRDPEAEEFDEILDELRESGASMSFQKYLNNTCLDQPHIELLITILDAFSGAEGAMRIYLSDESYFNEEAAFRRIITEGGRATYADLITFAAYAQVFQVHGEEMDGEKFTEWMRVVRNLTVNSNIERPYQFRRALRSINRLLPKVVDILEFLIEDECNIEVFSVQQVREERIKAGLIRKSDRWKDAVLEAEQHGYFKGQIEFLLDFSGVLDAWKADSSCDWSSGEDDEYFAEFQSYFEKACLLFDRSGLIKHGEFRTERALLAIGNYMFARGQNHSFLENADDPVSWKRLLRGEQLNNPGPRRGYLKKLLDEIDVTTSVVESLDRVIEDTDVAEDWRRLIVENPKLIDYCGKRQIRYYADDNVYLLKGVRRSGEHVDLFSYHFFVTELSEKHARGELTPFGPPRYCAVHTDSEEPDIRLHCEDGDDRIHLLIWNKGSTFEIRLWSSADELPDDLKERCGEQPGFEFDDDGDLRLNVDVSDVSENLDVIVEAVREYLAE